MNINLKQFRNPPTLFLILSFMTIALCYSIINPLFEAPDEIWHHEYIRWLKEGHGLAEPADIGHAPWEQEGTQSPLYYMLGSILISAISTADSQAIQYNPHANIGNAHALGNKNQMIHGPHDSWPWQGITLSAHILRFYSIVLGTITVLFTSLIARRLSHSSNMVVLATCLVAFNPQFIFISASISNDNLVTALSTITLWFLLVILSQDSPLSFKQRILLGMLVGCMMLSKLSGLLIIPITLLSFLYLAWQRRSGSEFIWNSCIVGLVAFIISSWWYIRNWILFGDPLALNAMFAVLPARAESATFAELITLIPGIWRSFWAVFGWFNIVVDEWLYLFYTTVITLAALGLVYKFIKHALTSRQFFSHKMLLGSLLVAWSGGIILLLLRWAQINYPQGRLLFPAIGAMMPLYAYGLLYWLPHKVQKYVAVNLCLTLITIALFVPFRWIKPIYSATDFTQNPPEMIEPLAVDFGPHIRLEGYTLSEQSLQRSLQPGDDIDLTLYWRLLTPTVTDYSIFLHAVDELEIIIAQRDSYPGLGNLPTSQWPRQKLIADPHRITIPPTTYTPSSLRLYLGVYDFTTGQRLSNTETDRLLVHSFELEKSDHQPLANPQYINFDNQIALRGYELEQRVLSPGDTLTLTLWWEALQNVEQDYKVFTHLVLPPSTVWAQDDQIPHEGQMPTSTWQKGDSVEDVYRLALPAEMPVDIYRIEVGLYHAQSGERLPVNFSTQGVSLGQVKVQVE